MSQSFDDDPLKTIQVTEQTRLVLAILSISKANSRAITPKCFMGSGWFSKFFTKFDNYTMKTIEVIERTNALDAVGQPAAASIPIMRPVFKQAYKNLPFPKTPLNQKTL